MEQPVVYEGEGVIHVTFSVQVIELIKGSCDEVDYDVKRFEVNEKRRKGGRIKFDKLVLLDSGANMSATGGAHR